MRIVIISSPDYKEYTVEAEYRDGAWTGNQDVIEIAKSKAKQWKLDLDTQEGAKDLEAVFAGSRLWAKVVDAEWELKTE